MTMASPARTRTVDGARYVGSENSKTLIAGPEVMTARPRAAAASAVSAASGLDSRRAHRRLVMADTAQTYRRWRPGLIGRRCSASHPFDRGRWPGGPPSG